ncbi:MAG: cation transporter [Bacteroidales bacterium]|nr:cation transporter [Bacteroidales bacterium]
MSDTHSHTLEHEHEHEHGHHHHHHVEKLTSLNGVFILSIVLNLAFVLVETGVGIGTGSLGLLSDAGHNLSDVFSLLLALIAFRLAASHATKRFTYGYRKSSVLISLLNAIILLVAVGVILVESIHKLLDINSIDVNGSAISWTAGVGILVNGFTAWLLMKQQAHDVNTRGAFLHMLADTLVSVGVVVSGIIISLTGWGWIDPVIGIVIAIIILVSTWQLLSESLRLSIDAVPESIDPDEIIAEMKEVPGITDVHHLHIWPISTTQVALTAHIVLDELGCMQEVIPALKAHLKEHGIDHSTLEVETAGSLCHDHDCC